MIVAIIILGSISFVCATCVIVNWQNNQRKLHEKEIELELTKSRYSR